MTTTTPTSAQPGTVTHAGDGWATSREGRFARFATQADAEAALRLTGEQWPMAAEIAQMIRDDISSGHVSENVRTWADLHDYVDANDYALMAAENAGVQGDNALWFAVEALGWGLFAAARVWEIRPTNAVMAEELLCASAQGLDPVMHWLGVDGRPFWLWQSGGWCMVVMVPVGGSAEVGITAGATGWTVCYYPDGPDTEDEDAAVIAADGVTTGQLLDLLARPEILAGAR